MKTLKLMPRDMLAEIDAVLTRHKHGTLAVYAAAEQIRQRWEHQNIALEDIIAVLVEESGRHDVSIAFDPSEAAHSLLGQSPKSLH